MARAHLLQRRVGWSLVAWTLGFMIFFPILWTILTSFKTEADAFASPPKFLFFDWTTENYGIVQERSDYVKFAANSLLLSLGSTLVALLFAIPAAWAMAFASTKRAKDLLVWMLSTKMMPPVGALIPIYLLFRDAALLDSRCGLILVLCLLNLPIVVWMLYTYFKEIPSEILEAARMDGASLWQELAHVLAPMAVPGVASTVLLNVILAWNESFWTLNLTTSDAAPLTQFIASYSSPEGLFWAKLSAASTMAVAPILVLGWFAQKQLVRGLTFGAVREPKAFLFDEPLSNLDAALRVNMRIEIMQLHQKLGSTMIYVTHDQVEAMTMADRIVVLNRGNIEQVGSPLDLYNKPKTLFVAGFIGSPKMNFLAGGEASKYKATTVGIRPEHLHISRDKGTWRGVVSLAEHLGADTYLHVDAGRLGQLTVRAPGEYPAAPGSAIWLTPEETRIHRFDDQGERFDEKA